MTLTLTPNGGAETELRLEHTVPIETARNVAGALFVGPGWDGAFLGLGLYLAGEAIGDPREFENSPEVVRFNVASIDRWVSVVEQAGAPAEAVTQLRAISLAQFAPGTPEAEQAGGA